MEAKCLMSGVAGGKEGVRAWVSASWDSKWRWEPSGRLQRVRTGNGPKSNRTRQSTVPAARKMTGNPNIGRRASATPSI